MHLQRIHLFPETYPTRELYPFSLEIFQRTEALEFSRPVTFFVGDNGTGKSTLLRAIAKKCHIYIWKEEERTRYHYNPYEEDLYKYLRVDWKKGRVPGSYFASEIFRHFAELLDEWAAADPDFLQYFGNESLMEKSHGQSHMAFFSSRFQREGLYLLDEPETALSPRMQVELLKVLRKVTPNGSAQFLIATHSPILLAYPDAEIYSFDQAPIQKVEYEETDYYRIYRDFLNHRERYL